MCVDKSILNNVFGLEFKMKSCFVVAQIYPTTHVQLTLHQVVRLLSPQKPAATVIIQDKIVHIEDIYDTLCQKIWAIMLSGHVEYCTTHKNERNDFGFYFQTTAIFVIN